MAKKLRERDIEKHLVKRVKALGGAVRKVQWVGRKSAPDRVVMLPGKVDEIRTLDFIDATDDMTDAEIVARTQATVWVELKNPETIKTFPADAHERAQHREHERMRKMGQRVVVIGTIEQVEELLS